MQIPFVPLKLRKAVKASKPLLFLGEIVSKSMPSLKLNLYQADIPLTPREYVALALFSAGFYFVLLSVLTFSVGIIAGSHSLLFPVFVGALFSFVVYIYLINYPKLMTARKTRELEKELITALQHILIEVKSGVPLFNALISVSEGYGKISLEFKRIVKEVNTGVEESEALDEASRRNPSIHFRRALWQIVNTLRSGSDITKALESIVNELIRDHVRAIRNYGQELNPYVMVYMLVAVILPTLGITFLVIISSFSGITVPKIIFPAIIVAIAMFQFFYMGIIKTKRPIMEV